MHPTIKVVALFKDKVNSKEMGVPVHQVKEFADRYSFGCSISSKPFLRLAMLDHPNYQDIVDKKWDYMAIYYAMIVPKSFGKIIQIPFFNDPIIYYSLNDEDLKNISEGLKNLCKLLLSSGAITLFPTVKHSTPITDLNGINTMSDRIKPSDLNLMTIHLFSSCPMGENRDICVANSYGKVFGQERLYIADGSILPTAPGVNPQGTIMALAHKNIEEIISLS